MNGAPPRSGRVEWIGVRPGRGEPVVVVDEVEAEVGHGLVGDRWAPVRGGPGTRQVTLIQAEHIPVVASLLGRDDLDPALLRRNLVVSGINLTSLQRQEIEVGGARLVIEGMCAPCSKMEVALGPGGYDALRGHGGWNARVVRAGTIAVGDAVRVVDR